MPVLKFEKGFDYENILNYDMRAGGRWEFRNVFEWGGGGGGVSGCHFLTFISYIFNLFFREDYKLD